MKHKIKYYVAPKKFKSSEIIVCLGNNETSKDNPYRIQVSNNLYILPPVCLRHSCKPNSFVDWQENNLVALKTINKGELVTYHYGTSEDDYAIGAFDCICGEQGCVKLFKGYRYMSGERREEIRSHISPFLNGKYYS